MHRYTSLSIIPFLTRNISKLFCNLRKSFHPEECNSEISFLSETTRNSTPLNGSPNLRTNSLRLRKEDKAQASPLTQEPSVKSNPDLTKASSFETEEDRRELSDNVHILTLQNEKFETVPFGLSQDIPDVFL